MMNKNDETNSEIKEVKGLKKLKLDFAKLSAGKKVQVIVASVLTMALLVGIPVYAWFATAGKIEAFTKIKEPDNLDIRAGHFDDAKYFSLNDIDLEKVAGVGEYSDDGRTPHCVVFSVSAGDYKIPYQIQLAHTTNIPFKYEIYRAKEYALGDSKAPADPDVTYVSIPAQERGEANYTFLYAKVEKITLTPRNADPSSSGTYGRQLAMRSDDYYNDTYLGSDDPEIYAVPIYEQSGEIRYDAGSDHDYFILVISWDDTADTDGFFAEWNKATNQKETDMIYLTASRYSK